MNIEKHISDENPAYKNAALPLEKRVEDLLARMTLEEKTAQLQCLIIQDVLAENTIGPEGIGGMALIRIHMPYTVKEETEQLNKLQRYMVENTRLGIPAILHGEALHGFVARGATSFPQAIGLAATWNTGLMSEISAAIAGETKSRGIRQVLSPTVDIARDVRWGRVAETYGEDPYLTSRMAVAFCKSLEQRNVITTPKHFVANCGDGGRDSHSVYHSERHLRDIYFKPYEACIKEAGSRSIMVSYNAVNGLPSGINRWLLTDILREDWGFKGFVVTDYGIMGKLWQTQGAAKDRMDAAVKAISAGLDRDLPRISNTSAYQDLVEAVRNGQLSEKVLDRAVERVLRVKFEIGLFENPYGDPEEAQRLNGCEEHRALALRAAQQSIVLLKNESNTLPLKKGLKKITVLGVDAEESKLGDYCSWDIKTVSILEGIQNHCGADTQVEYIKTEFIRSNGYTAIPNAYLQYEEDGEISSGLKAHYFNNPDMQGEVAFERVDQNIHFIWDTASPRPDKIKGGARFSVYWAGKLVSPQTGNCTLCLSAHGSIRLYLDGKKLIDRWDDPIVESEAISCELVEGREYDLTVEYAAVGKYRFVSLGWDIKNKGSIDFDNAISSARMADVAVIVAGITEGEGKDRACLNLVPAMEQLIVKVTETGTPTVVILAAGSAVTMKNWIKKVGAIVDIWYPGVEGGNAVADVLFGDYNPSGRLPITFPQSSEQLPLYYNHEPSGRSYGYVDISQEPLFPFGFGLSYTTFTYSNLRFSSDAIKTEETVQVYADIRNTGETRGDEVVQLYLRDVQSTYSRPLKELKDFARISLEPGEVKTVCFELTPAKLAVLDENLKAVVEPGEFKVMIGASSSDIRLEGYFNVK